MNIGPTRVAHSALVRSCLILPTGPARPGPARDRVKAFLAETFCRGALETIGGSNEAALAELFRVDPGPVIIAPGCAPAPSSEVTRAASALRLPWERRPPRCFTG